MKSKFFILWSAGVISTAIGLPYILELQQSVLEKSSLSLVAIGLIGLTQSAVLLAIAVFFGLKLSDKIGLNSSFFSKDIHLANLLKISIPTGIAVAVVIRLADVFFLKKIPALALASEEMPFWKALSVAPYGGVVEELLLRLFITSLFAWLLGKVVKSTNVSKNSVIMWVAIVSATVLFGIGHLPATATITPLTSLVIMRALLLNGVAGLIFGWLYWKKGLTYSVSTHFTADVILHTILPLFFS